MDCLEDRIASLAKWPGRTVAAVRTSLAEAGFIYTGTGRGDTVECFMCGTTVSNWKDGDSPAQRHALSLPGCPFMRSAHPGVVQRLMAAEDRRTATFPPDWCCDTTTSSDGDVCGTGCARWIAGEGFFLCEGREVCCVACLVEFELSVRTETESEEEDEDDGDDEEEQADSGGSSDDCADGRDAFNRLDDVWEKHIAVNHVCPAVLKLSRPSLFQLLRDSPVARMATLHGDWPSNHIVDSQSLVNAGLFHTLHSDVVRCSECGKGLQDWETGDSPWLEHGKLYPNCPLAIQFQTYSDAEARQQSFSACDELPCSTEAMARAGFFFSTHDSVARCYYCLGKVAMCDIPTDMDDLWQVHSSLSSRCPHVLRLAPVSVLSDQFCLKTDRSQSLESFPDCMPPMGSERLARSGFYYCFAGDLVRCFKCGVTLGSWENGDDPWLEHWRHSPHCLLLRSPIPGSPTWLPLLVSNSLQPGQLDHFLAAASTEGTLSVLANWPQGVALTEEALARQLSIVGGCVPSSWSAAVAACQTLASSNAEPSAKKRFTADDRLICKICMDKEVGIVFEPCGHVACCKDCCEQVRECPLCRKAITHRIRAYL